MKIEKINDNQIKCTLTQEDLEQRHLKISELLYGNEKAKALFRDVMQQAQREVGFVPDNIPIMVEAIPLGTGSLVMIITKVEDPEELDTRFTKFTPFNKHTERESAPEIKRADDIIDLIKKLDDIKKGPNVKKADLKGAKKGRPAFDLIRRFSFDKLDTVISASASLGQFYNGTNSLYRRKADGQYILVVHQSSLSPEDFNKVCNVLSEYAKPGELNLAGEAHLTEHETTVISKNAVQQLGRLKR